MRKNSSVLSYILLFLVFIFPFEYKYERVFRTFYKFFIKNTPIPEIYKNIAYIYVSEIVILLLAVVAIIKYRYSLREFFFDGPIKYFSFFFVFSVISLGSLSIQHPGICVFYLLRVFVPLLLVALIYKYFDESTIKGLIKKIFYCVFFISLIQAGIAITQYFTQAPIGLRILGEVDVSFNNPSICTYGINNGTRWIFDNLLSIDRHTDSVIRAYGTFKHPNILGGFFVFSLMAICFLFLHSKEKYKKIIFGSLIFLEVFSLFITFSRSALFGWTLALFVFFTLIFVKKLYNIKQVKSLAILLVLAIGVNFTLFYPQLINRGGIIGTSAISRGADLNRTAHHTECIAIAKNNPTKGVGLDQYHVKKRIDILGYSHNIYLLIAAEVGIFGLFGFVIYFGSVLFFSFFKREMDLYSISLFSLIIAFLFIGMCDFYLYKCQEGKLMLYVSAALLSCTSKRKTVLEAKQQCQC